MDSIPQPMTKHEIICTHVHVCMCIQTHYFCLDLFENNFVLLHDVLAYLVPKHSEEYILSGFPDAHSL